MKFRDSFHPYAWVTVFFWSLAYVFTRFALQHFTAFPLGFLRYVFASAALIVIALVTKMKQPLTRIDGKLYIPLNNLASALGAKVTTNKIAKTITVTK